jgi:DNA repair protein RecN (Recombination protein N)
MLSRLSIRNVVLIEAVDLDFGGGLAVLTGETGAGKSILLDSLGLALGNRADSALVRTGVDKASVTATFDFDPWPPALVSLLEEADMELEQSEPLIVRRQLKADGKSRAFVNDQPASVGLLRDIGALLVEIHGQHDDRGMVNASGHRALLDRYAGTATETGKVADAWREWRAAATELAGARERIEQASADQELLLAHLEELSALSPCEGEEAELAARRADLQKGERLGGDLEELRHVWEGSESPLASLRAAARRLDRIAGEHPLLADALAALDRAVIEAGEAEEKLGEAARTLIHDAGALDAAETRLFELRALARKHRCEADELPARMRELRAELDAIETGTSRLTDLAKREKEAQAGFATACARLSEQRRKAAVRLDRAVAAELKPLKLSDARFQTMVTELPLDRAGADGADIVEFTIATNPGAPLAPLAKIASGGELSRFILALKVALAERGGAAAMIFDEIDRGVGGAVASAIGERLSRLADNGQVLVVTHSPQVAALGRTHYLIAKSSEGTVTRTSVERLDQALRREEIARMLSGAEVTAEARAQAERLLEGV